MNKSLATVFIATVAVAVVTGIAVLQSYSTYEFMPQQCNIVPTGRTHKAVAAITADEGKPVGVVERTIAIEYVTICERAEWVKQ